MATKLQAFFAAHPIFSRTELTTHLGAHRSENPKAVDALLRYHVRAGHLLKLRRGLYAAVPAGTDPVDCPVDPYLLASRLAEDAVLGYHTALEVNGKAHSVFSGVPRPHRHGPAALPVPRTAFPRGRVSPEARAGRQGTVRRRDAGPGRPRPRGHRARTHARRPLRPARPRREASRRSGDHSARSSSSTWRQSRSTPCSLETRPRRPG